MTPGVGKFGIDLAGYLLGHLARDAHSAGGRKTFEPGGDLFFKDRASPSALDVNITERVTQGMGAVRDVEMAPRWIKTLCCKEFTHGTNP